MRLAFLTRKNLGRRPVRTWVTILGVASAMLLLILVGSLSAGLDRAMSGSEAARTLIVYRQNRYCPQTSNLPEWYADRIAKMDGVASALPVKVFLSNCRASLDVVAFQGAPAAALLETRNFDVISGDADAFRTRRNSALIGKAFADRRNLAVGDRFRFGTMNFEIAGVFTSSEPVEEGVVVTHLDFLQRSSPGGKPGVVTQIEVKVRNAADAERIAREIDDTFRSAEAPTDTRPKVAFLEGATRDLREILRFANWLAAACFVVMLVLVGNTVVMSVQERTRELGVLRTVGFEGRHLATLVLGEAWIIAGIGGLLGLAATWTVIHLTHLTIGSEGVIVEFVTSPELAAKGIAVALLAGTLAALVPALRASRVPVVAALRGT
jgi:putative ABC transport system permease protein